MRNVKIFLAAVCTLGAAILADSASAQSIGVNFTGGRATNPVSVTGSAGVVAQGNWNNLAGPNQATPQPLVLQDGSASGATITWTSTNLWDTGGTPTNENANLMFGYLDNTLTTNSTATVANLPASIAGTGSTPYNVIVYFAGDTAGRGGSFILNGTSIGSFVSKGVSSDGVFVQGTPGAPGTGVGATAGNYALFTGITGTTLSIQADAESIGSNQRLPINGFQVIAVVPEPSSLGLLALGAAGVVARGRRK